MARHQWQCDLFDGARLIPCCAQYAVHSPREHSLCPSEVLAGSDPGGAVAHFFPTRGGGCDRRPEGEGYVRALAKNRTERSLHSERTTHIAADRLACRCTRLSNDSHRAGMRIGTHDRCLGNGLEMASL